MIGRKKTTGRTLSVGRIKRKQERRKRRLVEAPDQDWARWDRAAKVSGLNFAEFARRALNAAAGSVLRLMGEEPDR